MITEQKASELIAPILRIGGIVAQNVIQGQMIVRFPSGEKFRLTVEKVKNDDCADAKAQLDAWEKASKS